MTQPPTTPQDDEQRQLEHVKLDLVAEFEGRMPAEQVTAQFDAIVAGFATAPVRTFIPVLARRRVRADLTSSQ